MLRDVFYYGNKPNVHPREKFATSLEDARQQSTTEHFWIINEFCDYTNFDWDWDFEFLPDGDVWAEEHNNVWPSQHQKDSGTWLCNADSNESLTVYRADVNVINRKNITSANWIILSPIEDIKFDFSWHPDPTEPSYIYVWGNQWHSGKVMPTIQYVPENIVRLTSGKAIGQIKYIENNIAILAQQPKNFTVFEEVEDFDFSWVPNPTSPPYIYVWGNQWNKPEDAISIQYVVEGATEYKYMAERTVRKPCKDNWKVPSDVDVSNFDFSWVPSPHEEPFIYQFGTQHQKTGGPQYITPGVHQNSAVKYIDMQGAKRLPNKNNFNILDNNVVVDFDYSWHPDDTEPPYIYVFGNNHYPSEIMPTVEYVVKGATQVKHMNNIIATLGVNKTNWIIHQSIDETKFNLSWVPNPKSPPYIYVWGNKYIEATLKPTIEYHVSGATEHKYMEKLVEVTPEWDKWVEVQAVDKTKFDFTWRPDPREPAYIYTWGNKYIDGELIPTLEYYCEDAIERKYMSNDVCVLPEFNKWVIPSNIDDSSFDYTWRPDPREPDFIYQFGTQWQKTGGPRYVCDNATEIKYLDTQKVKILPNKENWIVPNNIDISNFDFSWHPDDTSPPYVYRFPTQWAMSGGPTYTVEGATEVKYIDATKAIALPNKYNWEIHDYIDVDSFDFSWHPYAEDEPYIYVFGTQWQKTGGPRYLTPGIHKNSPIKYIDTRIIKAKRLPNKENWTVPNNIDVSNFDFSWHPDDTSPPYVYHFATQWAMSGGPVYTVPDAIEKKYIDVPKAKALPCKDNWEIHDYIDVDSFDFSWHPYAEDEPYIYVFGTQWQKTGGPKYITPGTHKNSPIKYIDTRIIKVKRLPNKNNFNILDNNVVVDFDYSWHPDDTEEPYIYVFGNNQYPAEVMPTIQYVPEEITKLNSGKPIGEIKYVNDIIATLGANKTNWDIPKHIDTTDFDFSWIPNPKDPGYIYEFGTQWQKTGGPRYIVPNAIEVKYIDTQKVKILPNKENWTIPDKIDVSNFDFSWHPDDTSPPYIYLFATQWAMSGGPTYTVLGATEKKYIDVPKAKALPCNDNWETPDSIDIDSFDYSWHPYAEDEPYIYQFGTQWQKTGGPRYLTPGTDENSPVKYIDTRIIKAKRLPNKQNWTIPDKIDVSNFDFSWHPDDTSPPYIYNFATQWALSGGPIYSVPHAVEHKYIDDQIAIALPDKENWEYNDNEIDSKGFDFSWHPYLEDQPYIYQFGTQWQKTGGPRYLTPGIHKNSPIKYIDTRIIKAKRLPNKQNWIVPDDIDIDSFDFSWHTDDTEIEPYIFQFGTQHQKTGGPQYVTSGIPRLASGKPIGQIKYVDSLKAKKLPNTKYWTNPNNSDVTTFDFSWHPDDTSPPTTYQFGTLLDKEDGPKYVHPNIMDDVVVYLERIEKQIETNIVEVFPKYIVTTTLEDLIKAHPNELFWALNPDLDYSEFDFEWRPSIEQAQYIHAFGSSESETTQTYLVNSAMWEKGFRELNWVVDKKLDDETLFKLFKKSDMFFVDKSNNESKERFEKLKQKFPNIQKTRYLNSWVDTINRCINRSTTELCWILNSELDYTDFNFEYYPNPWQMKMVQVFGTQWSHWGTTFMVNRETFAQDTKYIKIIEHLSNLNFVKDRKAKATNILYDIIYIDHGNIDMSKMLRNTIIKYQGSYIATLQKMLELLPVKKEHYVWIASTVCDYKDFDFTYICDPFAKEQLHVFPSDRQKFGDTFLVDVNKLRELIEDMNTLEDYVKINYNQGQRAKRLPPPVIITEGDTHVSSINTEFDFPYAVFTTSDNKDIDIVDNEPISLWTPESKNIQITSAGGTRIVVPKEAKEYVKRELYDYPYITTNSRLAKSSPMDIVFLSNGETGADENYNHLLKVTQGLPNRVTRVDGVSGRVAAYHAAAEASNTPWMFTVFAKLKVSNKFDWNWQPDRLQLPKHYVFHATNPVNGLKYGHMAMIAYNKKLTLANEGKGLDFTMDDEHEVLEINSGIANFNTDEWSTWRTSFREALKLRTENSEISKNRLEMWLTVGMGKFNEYSTEGAQHAVEYYEEVSGDFDKLKLSYDWPWLKAKFDKIYE